MAAGIGSALVLALFVVAVRLIVFPDLSDPTKADAVLVLGPPTVQRLETAQTLMDDGLATNLVISVPEGVEDDQEHTRLRDLCLGRSDRPVECITPEPFTTQGEARLAERLMEQRGWTSLLVVTSVTHVSRAQLLFDRCLDGAARAQFVSDERDYDARRWADEFLYQSGAWLKAVLTPGC
ncbi:YdcF family protein [Herbiconiux sp. CPCC 205716]|uniref:YdcF family protein n=1 Tax=Herbiconiux gentiana TaxID=2970912 RepID=A0ABT2GC01_9MICO|nr:YdcF family protein [Herbiconiux gentiana]MCS5713712.1 YdcF family protein [Herbiconiux gentiana]